jgi:hypothetical protein
MDLTAGEDATLKSLARMESKDGGPEAAAATMRQLWGLGELPIKKHGASAGIPRGPAVLAGDRREGSRRASEYLLAGGKSGFELGQHRLLGSRNLRPNTEQTTGRGGHRARSFQQLRFEASGPIGAELLGHGLDQVRPCDEKFGIGPTIEPGLEQGSRG